MNKAILIIQLFMLFAFGNAAANHIQLNNKKEGIMKKVTFNSEGLNLVGNLYYPTDFEEGKQYPAVVVNGTWTSVKEQMEHLYAKELATQGFIALAFDFRNYGESEGQPRFYESPQMKKEDIKNAVTYLMTLPEVDAQKIASIGVCAGAMYTLMAAAEDTRIKVVATAAPWLHDAEAVKWFYGGEEGVQAKIKAAQTAKEKFATTGEIDYIPTISTTDESAAMYGNFDYYLNEKRGAIPQWSAHKFAVMSWEDWLTVDAMPTAKSLTQPFILISSDACVLPQYAKNYFNNVENENKKLVWETTDLEGLAHQFYFYDDAATITKTVKTVSDWFNANM